MGRCIWAGSVLGGGPLEVWITLAQGSYPDYMQVLPQESAIVVGVIKHQLLDALKVCLAVTTPQDRRLRLRRIAEGLELYARTAEIGEMVRILPVVAPTTWPVGTLIGLNGLYLLQAVGPLRAEEVWLKMTDSEHPLRVDDAEFTALVMALVAAKPVPEDPDHGYDHGY